MITGHIFNVALWFQAILIFLTIIFLIVIFIFKKNYLSVFIILTIICYIMQYSEVNYYFNYNHLQPHAYLTFGRLVEVFPDAVIGFILHSKNIMKKIKKKKLSFFISFIFLIIISKFNEFDNIKTFNYGGIRLNIAALCIFIIFYLLPFEKINNIKIIRLIRQITNYTGGIYYMHILIGNSYTISIILKSKKNTVFGCSLIYLICYILSGIGNKIFSKNNLRYIFS
jgi:peptidoglycan/LPS O-acetylase OafA/YrhL